MEGDIFDYGRGGDKRRGEGNVGELEGRGEYDCVVSEI